MSAGGPAACEEVARSERTPEMTCLDALAQERRWCTCLRASAKRWVCAFPPPHPGAEQSGVKCIPPASQRTAAESGLALSP